mgnify:CR=1 FL=1
MVSLWANILTRDSVVDIHTVIVSASTDNEVFARRENDAAFHFGGENGVAIDIPFAQGGSRSCRQGDISTIGTLITTSRNLQIGNAHIFVRGGSGYSVGEAITGGTSTS